MNFSVHPVLYFFCTTLGFPAVVIDLLCRSVCSLFTGCECGPPLVHRAVFDHSPGGQEAAPVPGAENVRQERRPPGKKTRTVFYFLFWFLGTRNNHRTRTAELRIIFIFYFLLFFLCVLSGFVCPIEKNCAAELCLFFYFFCVFWPVSFVRLRKKLCVCFAKQRNMIIFASCVEVRFWGANLNFCLIRGRQRTVF